MKIKNTNQFKTVSGLLVAVMVAGSSVFAHGGSSASNVGSDEVRQAQQKLKDQGYDPGAVDGVIGIKTAEAIKKFQRYHGESATGELDSTTRTQLGVQAAGTADRDSNSVTSDSGASDSSAGSPGTAGTTTQNPDSNSNMSGDNAKSGTNSNTTSNSGTTGNSTNTNGNTGGTAGSGAGSAGGH